MMCLFLHHAVNEQSNAFFLSFLLRFLIANVEGSCVIEVRRAHCTLPTSATQPGAKTAICKILCETEFLEAEATPYASGCSDPLISTASDTVNESVPSTSIFPIMIYKNRINWIIVTESITEVGIK